MWLQLVMLLCWQNFEMMRNRDEQKLSWLARPVRLAWAEKARWWRVFACLLYDVLYHSPFDRENKCQKIARVRFE